MSASKPKHEFVLDAESLSIGGEAGAIVDRVSFRIGLGATLVIVGESGSGKSLSALALMGLLPPSLHLSGQALRFDGEDLLALSADKRRALRGSRIAMIFQEPMTALNPVYTVGQQIIEAMRVHERMPRSVARRRTLGLLQDVGIPSPEQRIDEYPHSLSGGMRQRVMIAMALACEPDLLIADEPTTALDVTIQAQVLALLQELKSRRRMGMLLITHDFGVAAEVADQIAVMYAGRIVEQADATSLFATPHHPYTLGLMAAMPNIDAAVDRLPTIGGAVPRPGAYPEGCRFHPRCPFALARCQTEVPPMTQIAPGHSVACWRAPLEPTC